MATSLRNTLGDHVPSRLRPYESAANDYDKRIAPTQRISQVSICLTRLSGDVLTADRSVAYSMTELFSRLHTCTTATALRLRRHLEYEESGYP